MDGVLPPRAELKNQVKDWTLASDVNLLKCLKQFSDKLIQRSVLLRDDIDNLESDAVQSAVEVEHCVQKLNLISTKHFTENRVYDEDFTRHVPVELESDLRKNGPTEFIPKIKDALSFSLNAIRLSHAQAPLTDATPTVTRIPEDPPVSIVSKVRAYPSSSDVSSFSNGESAEPVEDKPTLRHDGESSEEDEQPDHLEERDEASALKNEPFSDLQKELAAKLRLSVAGPEKPSNNQQTQPTVDDQRGPSVPQLSKTTQSKKASLFVDSESDEDLFSLPRGELPPPVPDKLDEEEDGDLFVPAVRKPAVPRKTAAPQNTAAAREPTPLNNKIFMDSDSDNDMFSASTTPKIQTPAEDRSRVPLKAADGKTAVKGLFSDDSDEDLFAGIRSPLQPKTTTTGNPPPPGDEIGPNQRDSKASTKPAGAVSTFGNIDPAKMLGSLKPAQENGPQPEVARPSPAEAAPVKTATSNASAAVRKAPTWKPAALFSDESDDDLFSGIVRKPGSPAQPSARGSQKDQPQPKEENNNQRGTGSSKLTSGKEEAEGSDLVANAGKKPVTLDQQRSAAGPVPELPTNSTVGNSATNGQTGVDKMAKANESSTTKGTTSSGMKPRVEAANSHEDDLFAAVPKPPGSGTREANRVQAVRKDPVNDKEDGVGEEQQRVTPGQPKEVTMRKKSLLGDEESDSDADLFTSMKIKPSSGTPPVPSQANDRSPESQGSPGIASMLEGATKEKQDGVAGLKVRREADGAPSGLFDEESDEDLFSGATSASEKLQRTIKAKLASVKTPTIDSSNSAATKDPAKPAVASPTVVSGLDNNQSNTGTARSPPVPALSAKSPRSFSNSRNMPNATDTEETVQRKDVTEDKTVAPSEKSSSFPAPQPVAAAGGPKTQEEKPEKPLKSTADDRASVKDTIASLGSILSSGVGRKPIGGVSMFGGMDPSKLLKTPSPEDVEEKTIPAEVKKDTGAAGAAEEGLLSCIGRERPRIKNKRKPPSRSHRQSRNLSEELSTEPFDPESGSLPSTAFPNASKEEEPAVIPVPEVAAAKPADRGETPQGPDANPVMQAIKESSKLFQELSDSDEDLFNALKSGRLPELTGKKDDIPVDPGKQPTVLASAGKLATRQMPERPVGTAAVPITGRKDREHVKQSIDETFEESPKSDDDLFPTLKSGRLATLTAEEDRTPVNPEERDPQLGLEPSEPSLAAMAEIPIPRQVPERPLGTTTILVSGTMDQGPSKQSTDETARFSESPESDEDFFPSSRSVGSTRQYDPSNKDLETGDHVAGFETRDGRISTAIEKSEPEIVSASSEPSVATAQETPAVSAVPDHSGLHSSVTAGSVHGPFGYSLTTSSRMVTEESADHPSKTAGPKDREENGAQLVSAGNAAFVPALPVLDGALGNRPDSPAKQQQNKPPLNLFGESSESEDDLFAPSKTGRGLVMKNDAVTSGKPEKPAAKNSLFSGDSSSDDELFKPKPKTASVKVTPKPAVRNSLFSDDDDDDLFSSKTKPQQPGKTA